MATKRMSMGLTRNKLLMGVLAVVLLAIGAIAVGGLGNDPVDASAWKQQTVDVAEDPSRFVFDGDHLIDEGDLAGLPAYGDGFVTQGWIYPAGTLSEDDPGVECEFNEEGLPTSCVPLYEPIGVWTCYGYHVGEGAATLAGYAVVTTQIFDFGEGDGSQSIVTAGMESIGLGEVTYRSITGGTGTYSKARGQQTQTFALRRGAMLPSGRMRSMPTSASQRQ